MKNYQLLNALLSKYWFIDPTEAQKLSPLLISILEGKTIEHPQLAAKSDHKTSIDTSFGAVELKDDVAILTNLIGPVTKYDTFCSYGSLSTAQQLKELSQNEKVRGVILDVDGPGGQAAGTRELFTTVTDLVAGGFPVVAYINNGMACSATYYSIAGAHSIIASQKTDCIGSLGAYTTLYDVSDALKQKGIKEHSIYALESPEKNLSFKKALENDYGPIQEELSVLVNQFHEDVLSVRQLDEKVLKGGSFLGEQALKLGLIDAIGTMDLCFEQINDFYTKHPTTMRFGNKFSKLSALTGTDVSAEQIEEANEQLNAGGITAVQLVQCAELEAVNTELEQERAAAKTLEEQVTSLTKERDDFKAQAEKFGKQPGTMNSNPLKKGTDQVEEEQPSALEEIAEMSHSKKLEENPLFNYTPEEDQ